MSSRNRIDRITGIATAWVIAFTWLITPSSPSQSQSPKPSISISLPSFSTLGHEFVARVHSERCTPGGIDWKLSTGCKLHVKAGNRSIISCNRLGYATITAIARGGGCNKATATTSLLVNDIGGVTVFFPCDRDPNLPGHIVIPPADLSRWYYRPEVVSSGRLGVVISHEQTVTLGCEASQ